MTEYPVTDALGVANLALGRISRPPLGSLEEGTLAAGECRRHFGQARDVALRTREWNFAETQAELPAAAEAPLFGYAYAYPLPADCVAVRGVVGATRNDWKVVQDAIQTDLAGPLQVIYTGSATPIVQWDAGFVDAAALQLAARIAPRLLGRGSALRKIQEEAAGAIEEAGMADSQEKGVETLPDADIVAVRDGRVGLDAATRWEDSF